MTSWTLALGLFTVAPVDTPADPPRSQVRRAILLAPVVGLLLGLCGAAVLIGARALYSQRIFDQPNDPLALALASVFAIAAVEIATGGLHLDGLSDSADGLAARGGRDRSLDAMRDPRIGAVGAATLILALLVSVLALALAVTRGHGTEAITTSVVAGRVAIVWGCTLPAARADGLGVWVSGVVGRRAALLETVAALAVPAALCLWDDDRSRSATAVVMAALPLALVVTAAVLLPLYRRIGGITGDLLGAACVITTTACLAIVAAAP
ncbi:MAG: adenosylcobinamide-GDP ribazoletransferase [Candidatus Nanopelagicales bacterium]